MSVHGYWLAVAIGAFVVISISMFIRLHYRERRKRDALNQEPLVSSEVRASTHELANETTKLRAGLHKMGQAPNPIAELVSAIAASHDHGNRNAEGQR